MNVLLDGRVMQENCESRLNVVPWKGVLPDKVLANSLRGIHPRYGFTDSAITLRLLVVNVDTSKRSMSKISSVLQQSDMRN